MEREDQDSRLNSHDFRLYLESLNTEYDYGHNVENKSEEEWN
jgi:hypothetical protein